MLVSFAVWGPLLSASLYLLQHLKVQYALRLPSGESIARARNLLPSGHLNICPKGLRGKSALTLGPRRARKRRGPLGIWGPLGIYSEERVVSLRERVIAPKGPFRQRRGLSKGAQRASFSYPPGPSY